MPLDARVQRFLRLLAAAGPADPLRQSIADRRVSLAELLRMGGAGPAVERIVNGWVLGAAGPLEARSYTPVGASSDLLGGLIFFHGGGHVAGSIDTHDAIARELAQSSGCRVVSVQYRLGPEHRFPAAVEDARAAVRFIAERAVDFGIDRARLGICGESAGGSLAAATCQSLSRERLLALQVLLCPIVDYGRGSASWRDFGRGFLIEEGTLTHDLLHYLPAGADLSDPRVSPLLADDLSGQPFTLIHTAEFDPLRDDAAAYATRLERAGCQVSYMCHPGMIHLFYGLVAVIPAAAAALAQIGAQIRAVLGQRREPVPLESEA